MHAIIHEHRDELIALARRSHVRHLEVFGSAATGDFEPGKPDVDLLVKFDVDAMESALHGYVGFIRAAEERFGGKVDVLNPDYVHNPYLRRGIDASRRELFRSDHAA